MKINVPPLSNKWALRMVGLMFFLNADVILVSLIYFDLVSWFEAFIIALCISLPEIPVWYWVLNHIFLNYVETGKEAIEETMREGYFYFNKRYWKQRFDAVRNPRSWFAKLVLKLIKILGAYGLFIVSAEPFPFGRTFTITFCVIARWPTGLIPIMIGNVVHLYGAAMLWESIFK